MLWYESPTWRCAALWPHCDISVSLPSETGRRCFLLSHYYRIRKGSGSTCEVLSSCRTLRIPRVNLSVNICVGSHWSKLTASNLLLQGWLLKCRAMSALPQLLLLWVKPQGSLHFHYFHKGLSGFQILRKHSSYLAFTFALINFFKANAKVWKQITNDISPYI